MLIAEIFTENLPKGISLAKPAGNVTLSALYCGIETHKCVRFIWFQVTCRFFHADVMSQAAASHLISHDTLFSLESN